MSDLPDIIAAFDECDPADRLELLIDFGRDLPPLDDHSASLRDAGLYLVHECQAPVFLKADVQDNTLRVVADVPKEAPIARGFVGLLLAVFDGMPASGFTTAPENMLQALGLHGLLGMQRTRGLMAIYQSLGSGVRGLGSGQSSGSGVRGQSSGSGVRGPGSGQSSGSGVRGPGSV